MLGNSSCHHFQISDQNQAFWNSLLAEMNKNQTTVNP